MYAIAATTAMAATTFIHTSLISPPGTRALYHDLVISPGRCSRNVPPPATTRDARSPPSRCSRYCLHSHEKDHCRSHLLCGVLSSRFLATVSAGARLRGGRGVASLRRRPAQPSLFATRSGVGDEFQHPADRLAPENRQLRDAP